ncbi:hypothetical protein Tco_0321524 [Tanacetum coccineum]
MDVDLIPVHQVSLNEQMRIFLLGKSNLALRGKIRKHRSTKTPLGRHKINPAQERTARWKRMSRIIDDCANQSSTHARFSVLPEANKKADTSPPHGGNTHPTKAHEDRKN